MENLVYRDRHDTNCVKWDILKKKYGHSDLLSMWIADIDFAAPECVRESLSEYCNFGIFGYYLTPESHTEAYLLWQQQRHGISPQKEWLRFIQGGVAGIYHCVSVLTSPGDTVACMLPAYPPFCAAPEKLGRQLSTCPLINNNGVYTVDFQALEEIFARRHPGLFIWCSPHNPTGRVWSEEEQIKVLELCRKYNVRIFADEIHQDLCLPGFHNIPLYKFTEYHDLMVCMNSPAKTFNLAACQSATLIIPDDKIRTLFDEAAMHAGNPAPSAFSRIAYAAAYSGGAEWLDTLMKQVDENRQLFLEILLAGEPRITVSPLEGTYLLWIDFGRVIPADELRSFIVDDCGLALNMGSEFGGAEYGSFVRLNLATSRENVQLAAKKIKTGLSKRYKP